MPTLRLCFLGPLDIRYDDQPLLKPPTLKSQSLLAYLVLHRQRPQPRDRLAGLFWGDRPERKARRSLTTALWHIRRCLPHETLMLSDSHTVQFDPQSDLWLDVEEFEAQASRDDTASLQSAVALYRGDFLDGFYDDWIISERYRLEALFSETLARLMGSHEARGDYQGALATALRLLDRDPLREDAHRLAMRAYCRLGQRNAALEQYHRCREIVLEELGTQPMAETTELYRAVLEGRFEVGRVPEVVPAAMPAVATVGRSPLDVMAPVKLVGRKQEMAFLDDCWQGIQVGHGQLALISGEAGLGKTRLVEEFANRLCWQGVRVLWGRCYEFERALPYQPVAEALRTVLPTLTSDELASFPAWTVAEVARLVPELLDKRHGLEPSAAPSLDQERTRLFESAARFLAELSSHGALLMVLEDLHWASESTLGLIHYLARHLTDHRVLTVGTFRPEAIGLEHPLLALRRRLTREGLAKLLRLSRLPPEAVEAMVVEMSGAGETVVPLAQRLYQETEGNPFFLMEIVKALFETGVVRLEEGTWRGDFARLSEETLPLPAGVSEAIQARVYRLNDDAQEALRLAAVLGREFDFDLLNAVWMQSEEATLEVLEDLLRHRLIDEGTGAMVRDYTFTHHKIQEVVYGGIPRRHRQHAHARVGVAMERLCGPQAKELASELAFHFEQGQQFDKTLTEKAITYLQQAGDQARLAYAHQEAIDSYQRALALLKEQGEHEPAARTLMKMGLTYHSAFDFRQARQAYEEGFALWQRAASMEWAVPLPPAPHALRTDWRDAATRLDPALADARGSIQLVQQLFSGLVALSPEMEVLPDVAQTWDVLDGGCRYLFHLRDDVRWSDGIPVTAHDFEYAWKRTLDPATGSTVADLLYEVKGAQAFHRGEGSDPGRVGVRALDKSTLEVELEGPTGYFLYLLAHSVTWPVPRHVVEKLGEAWTEGRNIVTNGPFRLESWRPGEWMILSRYPAYHGRFGGNIQRVELTLLPAGETPVALEMYEADELDILNLTPLSPAEMDAARQGHPGEYVRVPRLATSYVSFDMRRPPFNDVRVQRAFALATDKETLADVILRGFELPATGGFVPPGMPGHSPGIGLQYDPDRAGHLLAEAGFPGGRGFPTVEAMVLPGNLPHIQYLQARWKETLGVELSWRFAQAETSWGWLLSDPPQMLVVGWLADYPDPDSFLRTSTIPWCMGWGNKACERLVEAARRVTDQPERMKLYRQAEKILLKEARIVPLTYVPSHLLVKPWVGRYAMSAMVTHIWKDTIIEPH